MVKLLQHGLIAIALGSIFSCKKDIVPMGGMNENVVGLNKTSINADELQKKAQSWYENIYSKNLNVNGGAKNAFLGDPDWSRAMPFIWIDSLRPFVYVPLTGYKVDCSYLPDMNKTGFRNLLFREDFEGEIQTYVIELHPDSMYIVKKQQEFGLQNIETQETLRSIMNNNDFT